MKELYLTLGGPDSMKDFMCERSLYLGVSLSHSTDNRRVRKD